MLRRYQRLTPRLLPAGATVAGWVSFLPLDQRALSTAHEFFGLGISSPYQLLRFHARAAVIHLRHR